MVRMQTLFNNFSELNDAANQVQNMLVKMRDKARSEAQRTAFIHIQNRITELMDKVHFSLLLDNTGIPGLAVTDIDHVVSVDGEIRAIFELKRRRALAEDHFKVPNVQYRTLKQIWERTGIPVYYLIKYWNQGWRFHLVKLNFWRHELLGRGEKRDDYALIPISDGIECDAKGLVENLSSILL